MPDGAIRIAEAIRSMRPDIVLLSEVPLMDVASLAMKIGLRRFAASLSDRWPVAVLFISHLLDKTGPVPLDK
jgi:hypothetical protein